MTQNIANSLESALEATLESLTKRGVDQHLKGIQRGLEKESLRVDPSGLLAQTPHPEALGSTLTHPSITTDYSESLLEFVTAVHTDIPSLLKQLYDIHHFTYQHIGNEKLWVNSMPCIVESEQKIPIARYGCSNVAKMKEAYRQGLSHRYGALMQAIAGIHFNFSLPDAFWLEYHQEDDPVALQTLTSASYFDLIRNFHRNSWIGAYLFGASPAVCGSFVRGREHLLKNFDAHSFYAPNATSLRLSGLGYNTHAQANIEICYNNVDDFVKSLRQAIQTPHPDHQAIGVKVAGKYRQLNANLLQIENEFYSSIRPKRVTASAHSPSRALGTHGVEYIEVRSIDLNPFEPIGIHEDCIRFFDMFLLYCLFSPSPDMSKQEFLVSKENISIMALNGRDKNQNITADGKQVNARTEMHLILQRLSAIADVLDGINGGDDYHSCLAKQRNKVDDAALTPSARILKQMLSGDLSFYEFSMQESQVTEQKFKQEHFNPQIFRMYEDLAAESHQKRQAIEDSDQLSFDDFLSDYFQRQNASLP